MIIIIIFTINPFLPIPTQYTHTHNQLQDWPRLGYSEILLPTFDHIKSLGS